MLKKRKLTEYFAKTHLKIKLGKINEYLFSDNSAIVQIVTEFRLIVI